MPTAFDKLEKILRLEQSQGFRNRAVIGGIDGFAEIWRDEALRETQDQARIKQINEMAVDTPAEAANLLRKWIRHHD